MRINTSKIVVASLIGITISFSVFSQPIDVDIKRQIYEKTQKEIEDLEAKAQYSGDDEFVRKRNNLPPKLPSFEEWVKSTTTNETNSATKEVQSPELPASQETVQKIEPPAEQVVKSDINSNENKPTYVSTGTKSAIGYGVGILLYILSFLLYVKKPKLRKFSISTPFDIGCKNELTEAEQSVKWKKQWIEFGLLLLSIIIFLFFTLDSGQFSTGILNSLSSSLLAFLASLSVVVIGRFLAGWATSCSKCESTFARKCTNSYKEPKGTYEKVTNGVSGSRNVEFVQVMETGVKHADYLCTVCSHEWHEATQYAIQVSKHMRG